MALSGTSTFTLTVNDVIQEAYDRIGGDPILGYDVRSARRSMNIMFSDWANRGYNQWTVEYKTLAITTATIQYTLDYDTVDIINANIQISDGSEYAMTALGLNDYAAISNTSVPPSFQVRTPATVEGSTIKPFNLIGPPNRVTVVGVFEAVLDNAALFLLTTFMSDPAIYFS